MNTVFVSAWHSWLTESEKVHGKLLFIFPPAITAPTSWQWGKFMVQTIHLLSHQKHSIPSPPIRSGPCGGWESWAVVAANTEGTEGPGRDQQINERQWNWKNMGRRDQMTWLNWQVPAIDTQGLTELGEKVLVRSPWSRDPWQVAKPVLRWDVGAAHCLGALTVLWPLLAVHQLCNSTQNT